MRITQGTKDKIAVAITLSLLLLGVAVSCVGGALMVASISICAEDWPEVQYGTNINLGVFIIGGVCMCGGMIIMCLISYLIAPRNTGE